MFDNKALRNYIVGAAIVWAGIFLAMAITLRGSDDFVTSLIILSGGAVWFVLLVPGWLRTMIERDPSA
jgi:hypothetical protein